MMFLTASGVTLWLATFAIQFRDVKHALGIHRPNPDVFSPGRVSRPLGSRGLSACLCDQPHVRRDRRHSQRMAGDSRDALGFPIDRVVEFDPGLQHRTAVLQRKAKSVCRLGLMRNDIYFTNDPPSPQFAVQCLEMRCQHHPSRAAGGSDAVTAGEGSLNSCYRKPSPALRSRPSRWEGKVRRLNWKELNVSGTNARRMIANLYMTTQSTGG